jgi:hypothetical protein
MNHFCAIRKVREKRDPSNVPKNEHLFEVGFLETSDEAINGNEKEDVR